MQVLYNEWFWFTFATVSYVTFLVTWGRKMWQRSHYLRTKDMSLLQKLCVTLDRLDEIQTSDMTRGFIGMYLLFTVLFSISILIVFHRYG